ncbi:MAG: hypothetical protein IJS99_04040 [Synergistaceae bacterium]|nr:hypothetical protein [Synergistaceae bacterium]
MRRFITSLLIIACMSSSALADIHEFKYFSLNIPDDWAVSEKILENGTSIIAIVPEEGNNTPGALAMTSGNTGGLTVKEIAEKYAKDLGGSQPETDGEGNYFFSFNDGNSHAMTIGDENFYIFTAVSAINESNDILLDILNSLELK